MLVAISHRRIRGSAPIRCGPVRGDPGWGWAGREGVGVVRPAVGLPAGGVRPSRSRALHLSIGYGQMVFLCKGRKGCRLYPLWGCSDDRYLYAVASATCADATTRCAASSRSAAGVECRWARASRRSRRASGLSLPSTTTAPASAEGVCQGTSSQSAQAPNSDRSGSGSRRRRVVAAPALTSAAPVLRRIRTGLA